MGRSWRGGVILCFGSLSPRGWFDQFFPLPIYCYISPLWTVSLERPLKKNLSKCSWLKLLLDTGMRKVQNLSGFL